MTAIAYSGQLAVVTCWCGVRHAIPAELRGEQFRQHEHGRRMDVYCPLGHAHFPAGESEKEKVERRLLEERELSARLDAEREQAEASARGYKGAATKARKRAAAAVCPCCKRSFKQLRRHMAAKHPDYDPEVK